MRGLLAGKRRVELIALASVSMTVFLVIYTQILTARIDQIQSSLIWDLGERAHKGYKCAKDGYVESSGNGCGEKDETAASAHESSRKSKTTAVKTISFTIPSGFYNVTELNNTRNAKKETLFFNRVPKVGSQTMMVLIKQLSERNKFTVHDEEPQKTSPVELNYYEESLLTLMIDMFTPPSAFSKHSCFSNFTRHGHEMPIYINMVRDPIERVISWFYYVRAPWYVVDRKQRFPDLPLPETKWLRKDFESCVLEGDPECTFIPGKYEVAFGAFSKQAMFLCGNDEKCSEFNGRWAIEEAKRNVEKYYAVVGVLEEFDLTLKVLEAYVPRFFDGSEAFYKENQRHMSKINRNIYKPPVSESVKQILRPNFTNEIEFYNFCKQRLHMQYAAFMQNKNAR